MRQEEVVFRRPWRQRGSDGWLSPNADQSALLDGLELQLLELRDDDEIAVAVSSSVQEVKILVIVISLIEFRGLLDEGDDGVLKDFSGGLHGFFGSGLLGVAVVENDGSVLRAHIRALAIQGGRIVQIPEPIEDVVGGDFFGIKHQLNNFHVTGILCADLSIGGVGDEASHVAGDGGMDAIKLLVNSFHAPEAATSKGNCFEPLGDSFSVGRFLLHLGVFRSGWLAFWFTRGQTKCEHAEEGGQGDELHAGSIGGISRCATRRSGNSSSLPPVARLHSLLRMGDLALDISNVRKIYGRKVEALRGISLQVPKGRIFGLLGPNGAGKSTLVKILTTIIRPTSCEGTMLGQPIGHKPTLARIGYLPEHARFPEYLTGAQVLEFSAGLSGISPSQAAGRSAELLELVGMTDWKDRKLQTYSKGMKQRIGVAQALVNDPEIVFLDEPTDGVDPAGRRDIRILLERLREEGRTVFVNSHLLSELEMICDEVAILSHGEVKLQGGLKDLTGKQTEFRIGYEGELPEEVSELLRSNSCRHDTGVLIVPVLQATELMPLVDALRANGVVINQLERRSMSLEELFLDVVGEDKPGAMPPPLTTASKS